MSPWPFRRRTPASPGPPTASPAALANTIAMLLDPSLPNPPPSLLEPLRVNPLRLGPAVVRRLKSMPRPPGIHPQAVDVSEVMVEIGAEGVHGIMSYNEIMVACCAIDDDAAPGGVKYVIWPWPDGSIVADMSSDVPGRSVRKARTACAGQSSHGTGEGDGPLRDKKRASATKVLAAAIPAFLRLRRTSSPSSSSPLLAAKLPHPPNDAVTLRTYWWGYELYFPMSTMRRIDQALTSAQSVVAFLTALAVFAPVIYPFIGIIAAYIQLEYAVVKAQDQGKGVVIAAVWPLPVVFFPRPWDVVIFSAEKEVMTQGAVGELAIIEA